MRSISKSYPTGVRALLLEDAARRRRIETRFVTALESAGFAEVVVPMLDYADAYTSLLGSEAARRSYRFVDREGELVAVRSDFTPMIARALAPALEPADLPLRVFYRGDVIRVEATRLGTDRELFQIGAELVGDGSAEADAEMLSLAARLAAAFGIRPRVVLSDVALTGTLMASASDDPNVRAAIRRAFVSKRIADLEPQRPAIAAAAWTIIAKVVDGSVTLEDFHDYVPTTQIAERLRKVSAALDVADADWVLHLDEVEAASGYYTGIRFRLFANDDRTRLAQGGRYDQLYARFGTDTPAIGFTFTVDELGDLPPVEEVRA